MPLNVWKHLNTLSFETITLPPKAASSFPKQGLCIIDGLPFGIHFLAPMVVCIDKSPLLESIGLHLYFVMD